MDDKTLTAVCFSHIGKRRNHEDNYFINGTFLTAEMQKEMPDKHCCHFDDSGTMNVRLYAVSDGMGGHNAGEIASRICVEQLSVAYREVKHDSSLKDVVDHLQTVIAKINETTCRLSRQSVGLKGMGATLVVFVVCGDEYAVLNIGDSRAYYFINGKLTQVTKDNTEGQRMLDLGLLTRKELLGFPARKNLNRYIGFNQSGYILQAEEYYPALEGGIIMLCSDGISDFVSDERIAEILNSEINLEVAAKQLISEAVTCQNADNATVILIPLRR